MTVKQLYDVLGYSERLQVESAYNGKTLCKKFNPKKHNGIAEREVSTIYSAISIGFHTNYAGSYLRAMVVGDVEYNAEHDKGGE